MNQARQFLVGRQNSSMIYVVGGHINVNFPAFVYGSLPENQRRNPKVQQKINFQKTIKSIVVNLGWLLRTAIYIVLNIFIPKTPRRPSG
jgi:hypothetical protein